MELRTLAYIEAVARTGSFTAAARELHVAQPAVSAQIAGAERELGAALFVRTRTGARTTEAGRLAVARAREIHGHVVGLRADLDELDGVLRGSLRLGATPLLGSVDLPALVAEFRARHPGVRLAVRSALIADLLDRVEGGELDLVVGPLDGTAARPLLTRPLQPERLVVAVPSGSPTPPDLRALRTEPFICLPEGSGLRRLLDAACVVHGFTPQVTIEVSDPHQIPRYVAAGLGVALLARSVLDPCPQGVAEVALPGLPTHPPLGLISPPTPSAAARAFVALAEARLSPPQRRTTRSAASSRARSAPKPG